MATRHTFIGTQMYSYIISNNTPLYIIFCVDDSRRSSIEELQNTLPKNMVFSSHQIRLSNTVGQGKDLERQDPIILLRRVWGYINIDM